MRRSLAAAAIGGVASLVLVGCGLPDGVDGDLTDEWEGFAEPVAFVPDAPTCHTQPYAPTAALVDYQPVDCAQTHLVQTVHVGTFSDQEAEAPPEPGSGAMRQAYRECEERAADVLGADFRYGRLSLGVVTPTEAAWSGGARWFRCDLTEIEEVQGPAVERQGSFAGALAADSDSGLHLTCFTARLGDGGAVEERGEVPCDEAHQAEFVGIWRASGDAYPSFEDEEAERRVYAGCREAVADYVDVPKDGNLPFRTGVMADWMSEEDWRNGDRAFRCYLWLPEQELTASLRDAGTEGLPIHTE